ncbi:transcription factor Adf-1-like [Diabrotica virgifera virgifera]|uniref:MADF domain-containing protein n=1 Tax=Diabrotica virgifera virgifera TaxID=50390 RepID=A0ABM5JW57_DIAVI|nr:transcription factor Adf-1-like [Diabrotica virgifera virgifera]
MVPTEKLIELVKKYLILYDLSHEDYKNIRKKDKIWDEIGQEMKECREELKRRWRSLRDSYVRYLRVIKTRTGQGAQNKTWQWAESMKMFQPFLLFAKTSSNVPEVVTNVESATEKDDGVDVSRNEESEIGDISEVPLPTKNKESATCADVTTPIVEPEPKKRKVRNVQNTKPTSVDSIISLIKQFSGKRQAETKLQIAEIIAKQELMHYEEQQQQ